MQQGNLNLSWNTNNQFYGYVLDNNIYTYTGELIGVNLAKYQEVEAGLQKCRDKLVELGVIVPEKTPEEIIKEQSELLKKQSEVCNSLMAQMQEMNIKLAELKGGNNEFRTNQINTQPVANTEQTETVVSGGYNSKNSESGAELHKTRSSKCSKNQ